MAADDVDARVEQLRRLDAEMRRPRPPAPRGRRPTARSPDRRAAAIPRRRCPTRRTPALPPGGGRIGPLVKACDCSPPRNTSAVSPSLDPRVVGLHQHGPAGGLQRAGMCARRRGVGEPLRTNRSRADRRLDHHLAAGHADRLARREEPARHRRHTGRGQIGQIPLVGVPRHHLGRVEQVRHPPRPGQKLVEPVDVVPRRAQDHQIARSASPGRPRTASGHAARGLRSAATSPASSPSPSGRAGQPAKHDAGMERRRAGRASRSEA